MKILFDGSATQGYSPREETGVTLFHGGGEYAKYVLRKAIEMGYSEFDIVFERNRFIDHNVLDSLPSTVTVHYVNNTKEIYALIKNNKYDVFYSALAYGYPDYNSETTFAMVIHGSRGFELPWEYYRYKYFNNPVKKTFAFILSHCSQLQQILKRRNMQTMKRLLNVKNFRLITVSEHSKYSFLYFFPSLKGREIKVFYSPYPFKERVTPDMLKNKNSGGGIFYW
jgi:hypothetical protein